MSVELDPPELGFRRPFSHEVSQVLKLTNNNSDPVAFKVKTTAPKQYVNENIKRINLIRPPDTVCVQIQVSSMPASLLKFKAMKEDPPLDARCRDKFLVQSVAIDEEQVEHDANVWANLDQVARDSIKEKKIRVSFLPARDGGAAAATTNGTVDNHPRPLSSHPNIPQSHEVAPAHAPPSPPSAATSPNTAVPQTARDFSTPSKSTSESQAGAAAAGAAAGATGASLLSSSSATNSAPIAERAADVYNSAAQSVSNAASATGQTLQEQLDNAKETIISLKEQIQSQNLRQRQQAASGSDSKERSTSGSALATQQHAGEGVPVQMVAALCMLSFLIAYFFF